MTKLEPIIEDFGDGYVVFCPKCLSRLGWITDDIKKCPECHTEIEGAMTDEEALEDEKRICKTVAGEEAATGVFY